jgi:hypothetical protein
MIAALRGEQGIGLHPKFPLVGEELLELRGSGVVARH